ncbi:MAG: BrxA/BrxB family bacilliredoxin [Gemmatimonadales bacterium]|jgi:putative YphP/YqiW family bacilliredoxin|nr:MAG: BrxA/BrxB family bacilliredoxin [Gemmatimonadales bacterium]
MPYPEMLVQPMREDLVRIGFQELRTPADVDSVLGSETRTTLLVVNSVCGCAAGAARPGVYLSLQGEKKPEVLTTVFAGQDMDATERARQYISGYPPSSPSVALFKDQELVYMMERHQIEGSSPQQIAAALQEAYGEHC